MTPITWQAAVDDEEQRVFNNYVYLIIKINYVYLIIKINCCKQGICTSFYVFVSTNATKHIICHVNLNRFLFNCPIFWNYSELSYSRLGLSPKVNSWELLW